MANGRCRCAKRKGESSAGCQDAQIHSPDRLRRVGPLLTTDAPCIRLYRGGDLSSGGSALRKFFGLCAALAALSFAAPATSHHSFAMFDRDHPVEISGTVREFQWVNPHTWIQIIVPGEIRVTEWSIEGRSPNVLARRGWTRKSILPGDRVTLTIYPLLSGRPGGAIVSVKFADGRVLNADTPTAVDTNEEEPR
ncbi:MAG TPA: DUF6152 family protein [Sphingomonadaceae bacterium]|nr:DUF6152 family protein [Sphingomonadaceae bacterium]